MGLNFAVYEFMRQNYDSLLKRNDASTISAFKSMICGGFSGGISKLAVYPLDTVKRKFQSQVLKNTFDELSPFYKDKNLYGTDFVKYTSIRQCLKLVISKDGWGGLYRVSRSHQSRYVF